MKLVGFECSTCGKKYGPGGSLNVCTEDGGNLDVLLDFRGIRKVTSPEQIRAQGEGSMWRYLPLLPVADPGHVGSALRAVGWTPLMRAKRLGEELGLRSLWLKDDGRNPTASFKDRASALVVARAEQIGADVIITASTGNAGAALAGMAAAVGMPAVILAPKSAPAAKVAQLLIYGARVVLVDGTYDDAFDLTLEAAEELGWYCRNTGFNPFTAEGKKTAAFEICEQLGGRAGSEWVVPDALFVSVGDGNIITGLHKGFKDLRDLGWITAIPRIYGVQSTGSAAVANAFKSEANKITPVSANTIADSIAVDLPRDGLRALRAARETGGAILAVEDQSILQAISELGRGAIFAEPAAATSYAGVKEAVRLGLIGSDESIVAVITGSGLKDVTAAMRAAGEAVVVEPTLEAIRGVLT